MKQLTKRDFKYMFEPKFGVPDRYFTDEEEKAISEAKQKGEREIRINDEPVSLGYGARHVIKNPGYCNPDAEIDKIVQDALLAEFRRQLSTTKDAIAKGIKSDGTWPVDIHEDEWHYLSRDGENPVYDRWLKASASILPRAIAHIKAKAFKANPILEKRYNDYQDYKERVENNVKPTHLIKTTKEETPFWDGFYND